MEKLCNFCGNVYVEAEISRKVATKENNKYKVDDSFIVVYENRFIGEGSYGQVHEGVFLKNEVKTPVAVKVIQFSIPTSAENDTYVEAETNAMHELYVMCAVKHENIMKLIAWSKMITRSNDEDDVTYKIAMEMKSASLHDIFFPYKNYRNVYVDADIKTKVAVFKKVALGIANGIKVLHDNDIVHSDLKPDNILVSIEPSMELTRVQISDFGLSGGTETKRHASTREYEDFITSFDMFRNGSSWTLRDKSDDLYAFGIIIFNMFTGRKCYRTENDTEEGLFDGKIVFLTTFVYAKTDEISVQIKNVKKEWINVLLDSVTLFVDLNEQYSSFFSNIVDLIRGCCRPKCTYTIDVVLEKLNATFSELDSIEV